jgi:hypothetical protein
MREGLPGNESCWALKTDMVPVVTTRIHALPSEARRRGLHFLKREDWSGMHGIIQSRSGDRYDTWQSATCLSSHNCCGDQ